MFFYLTLILLTGCASTKKLYIVTTVEISHNVEPYWIKEQGSNVVVGMGEDQSREIAYQNALREIKIQIGEEIGVELSLTRSNKKTESDYSLTESSEVNVDVAVEAILCDVSSHISGHYWEHCRVQTGRKSFNDFYRYYIKADITPDFIDALRNLTLIENKKRLDQYQKHLDKAYQLLSGQNSVKYSEALYEYVQALGSAGVLLRGRELNIRKTLNEIKIILSRLSLETVSDYSEVRPERHYGEYQVQYNGIPAEGVLVSFKLEKGQGRIDRTVVSDKNGIVLCEIEMESMLKDNRLSAQVDLDELITQLKALQIPVVSAATYDIRDQNSKRKEIQTFTTMAKEARVEAGSLQIFNVTHDYNQIFRRVRNLNCRFFLEELNGRSVSFNNYKALVICNYGSGIPLLSSKTSCCSKHGEYHFSQPLKLPYEERKVYLLKQMETIAMLINDLKANHEWRIKNIEIELTLYGEDDAGNELSVVTSSGMIPWKNLFEK
ncbi:hypothetical protein K9N50_12475 [bacterium]|nr:hypothetical protein [bacterium]